MRWVVVYAIGLAAPLGLLAAPVRAQQPAGATPPPVASSLDALRPKTQSSTRARFYEEKAKYQRPTTSRYGLPRVQDRTSRAAVFQGVGNYFPAMRPGQGPNFNAVDPKTKGIPGLRPPAVMRGR